MKKTIINILIICSLTEVNAMSLILENQMEEPIYIESIKTKGSLVINGPEIAGICLEKKDRQPIKIEVLLPDCRLEDNFVELSIYDKNSGEYKPFRIMWDRVNVSDDHNDDDIISFIVNRQSDGRASFVYTIRSAKKEVVEELESVARQQIRSSRTSQQKINDKIIARTLGLPLSTVRKLASEISE